MIKRSHFLILLCLLFVIPQRSIAWGVTGHRVVGQVADSYLKSKTRKELKKILGNESVAMSSNWMDFVKSNPSYKYMSNWHYVDLLEGKTYDQVKQELVNDTSTNVYTRLLYVTGELKKKETPLEMKQAYLRILIHLVGDIHQPLHCRGEEQGGNEIKITWFNNPSNMHTLWDSELINFQQLSYTEYAAAINHPTALQKTGWQKDELTKWIYESYKLGDDIFKEAKVNTKFSYKYNYDHIATINEQLLKGGIRLAGLLNEIFS